MLTTPTAGILPRCPGYPAVDMTFTVGSHDELIDLDTKLPPLPTMAQDVDVREPELLPRTRSTPRLAYICLADFLNWPHGCRH